MWAVIFTVVACALLGTLIWLGASIRKSFGETALTGMCVFALGVVAFLTFVFLIVKEVQG